MSGLDAALASAILQYTIAGVSNGFVYGLVAIGFTLTFMSAGFINFAHGNAVMIGGLVIYSFVVGLGAGWLVGGLAAVATAVALMAPLFFLATRTPTRADPGHTKIFLGVAYLLVLQGVALLLWGRDNRSVPAPLPLGSIAVLGAFVRPQSLLIIGVTVSVLAGLTYLFRVTVIGKALIAVAEDPVAAETLGYDSGALIRYALALGTALGALAGILVVPVTGMSFLDGDLFTFKGATAFMIGGTTSITGGIVAGLLIGIIEALVGGLISTHLKDAVTMALLIAVIVWRPRGLLGPGVTRA